MMTPVAYQRSRKQEAEVAGRVGGKPTPASGAKAVKGDVQLKRVVRIECKTTANKSFSVTRDMLHKIEDAALSGGEVPAIVVEFVNKAGKPIGAVVVMPEWALDLIANYAKS
jgi:Holliday junction resolvase